MYRGILFALATMAVCLSLTAGVQAAPIGAQAFADIGSPTAGGSTTGNINTATAFTIGNMISTSNSTGIFTGMSTQTFGTVSFNLGTATSLAFGNSVFGSFASTSIVEATNIPGSIAIYVLGNWTPGTQGGQSGGPFASSFTITYNQTPPGAGGAISDSATFSTPPTLMPGVPEPASIVMGLTSLVLCGGVYGYRSRRSARIATA
jgi:hypothetical protein